MERLDLKGGQSSSKVYAFVHYTKYNSWSLGYFLNKSILIKNRVTMQFE